MNLEEYYKIVRGKDNLKLYFDVKELVPEKVFQRFGDMSIRYIDPYILADINKLRHNLGLPITINNWAWGGKFHNRGFRPRTYTASKAVYGLHYLGKALDFDVKGMSADAVRHYIIDNRTDYPNITVLEANTSWVHADSRVVVDDTYIQLV